MKSNVKLEDLQIFEHASQIVAIVIKNGLVGVDGVMHTFINNETLAEFLATQRKLSPKSTFQYVEDQLGTAALFAILNKFEAFSLHSIVGTEFIISAEDLAPMFDILDSFSILNSIRKGKITTNEAATMMHDKVVFFHSEEKHSALEKNNSNWSNNKFATKISVFLNHNDAVQAEQSNSIASSTISELAAKFNYLLPIIVEPQRDFCVEFAPTLFR